MQDHFLSATRQRPPTRYCPGAVGLAWYTFFAIGLLPFLLTCHASHIYTASSEGRIDDDIIRHSYREPIAPALLGPPRSYDQPAFDFLCRWSIPPFAILFIRETPSIPLVGSGVEPAVWAADRAAVRSSPEDQSCTCSFVVQHLPAAGLILPWLRLVREPPIFPSLLLGKRR